MNDFSPIMQFSAMYLDRIHKLLTLILTEESEKIARIAEVMASHIQADKLVYVYGPGGHSNIAALEVFFRAGGLAHISSILDEGTMLSNGARRSISMERLPGYGRSVIRNQNLGPGDLLLLVSAYGVNSALIDAAIEARSRGVFVVGLSSHAHAISCPPDHPARHPTKQNLQDIVDIGLDTKVSTGDALVHIPPMEQLVGPASTFANIFALNCIVVQTVAALVTRGTTPAVWRSANAQGGDEANAELMSRLRGRIKCL